MAKRLELFHKTISQQTAQNLNQFFMATNREIEKLQKQEKEDRTKFKDDYKC